MSIYQFIRNTETENHVKWHHGDSTSQILTRKFYKTQPVLSTNKTGIFFYFVFLAESSGWCEFGKVLNSDWNTALEETWVQLRQGEARQPILMLKKKVMAVSENPFWTRSVLEMATVSIPGWSQVPLRQCFSNLGGCQIIWGVVTSTDT